MTYYMIYVRDEGSWSPQFGDKDLEVVRQEREGRLSTPALALAGYCPMRSKRDSVQGKRMTSDQVAKTPAADRVVELPKPSEDQLEYLGRVRLEAGPFDASTVVGGPSRIGKPSEVVRQEREDSYLRQRGLGYEDDGKYSAKDIRIEKFARATNADINARTTELNKS